MKVLFSIGFAMNPEWKVIKANKQEKNMSRKKTPISDYKMGDKRFIDNTMHNLSLVMSY